MIGRPRACSSCGGILLGRRTRFCASCAPKRSASDPRYGSPQWKRTVLAVKRRDGWRCQHCGATERLVVDHRTPHDRFPGLLRHDQPGTLCSADNNSKRDLTVDEWKAALARRAPTSRDRRAAGPEHLRHQRTAPVSHPQEASVVPRRVRSRRSTRPSRPSAGTRAPRHLARPVRPVRAARPGTRRGRG